MVIENKNPPFKSQRGFTHLPVCLIIDYNSQIEAGGDYQQITKDTIILKYNRKEK